MQWSDLPSKDRKGSRPRCLLLTDESQGRDAVTARLSTLLAPHGIISTEDRWHPRGLMAPAEVMLHDASEVLPADQRVALRDWWLASRRSARTPVWDLVSTAWIGARRGLLLVEAKAHHSELHEDGKALPDPESMGSIANHAKIGDAVAQAAAALEAATGRRVSLSINSHYQLANRLAWGWKLATMGVPVVLLYLGFLGATEWPDGFADDTEWSAAIHAHGVHVDPAVWGTTIDCGAAPLIPLLRTVRVDLPEPT